MTGLAPDQRFANHKRGIKATPLVSRYGVSQLRELYEHPNPKPFGAASQMEQDLAEDLRQADTVTARH